MRPCRERAARDLPEDLGLLFDDRTEDLGCVDGKYQGCEGPGSGSRLRDLRNQTKSPVAQV
jgi:hypothetical protein